MPLLLNTATAVLDVVTTTTQVLHCHVDIVDMANGASTVTPQPAQNTIINSAATTSIAGSPAASTSRAIQSVSILNTDVAAVTITVKHNDGTNTANVKTLTLPSGYSYCYESKRGWYLTDASGTEVIDNSYTPGLYITTQRITSGTAIVLSNRTNKIRYRMWAAGGQGGGAPAVAGECGSGGGAGSYAEGEFTAGVSPSASLTCAIGAGGSTGGTGAGGQTGGNTTLTVGATTVTCNGGVGGAAGSSVSVPVLGGVGGAAGTNGGINIPGAAGEPNITIGTAADNRSGAGANSDVGNGGAPLLEASNATGNAAGGFGAGGGGASTTGTARAGGAGSGGLIIIDEYTG